MKNIVPRWKGKVQGGRFVPFMEYENDYDIHLSSLEDKICYLTITDQEPDRSDNQNRYYRGAIVRDVANHIGITRDEAHALLGSMFLKEYVVAPHVDKITGEVTQRKYTVVKSTASLSKNEMKEYIEECLRWASMELGLYIPDAISVDTEINT